MSRYCRYHPGPLAQYNEPMIKRVRVWVLGEAWWVEMYTTEEFRKFESDPDDFPGFCDPETCTIKLCDASLSVGLIHHELFHAYHCYLYAPSAELKPLQYEETIALLLEHWGEKLCDQSRKVYARLHRALQNK